jgi:hypothetical protein
MRIDKIAAFTPLGEAKLMRLSWHMYSTRRSPARSLFERSQNLQAARKRKACRQRHRGLSFAVLPADDNQRIASL